MRKLRQALIDFFFVLRRWREYHDIILTMHQPWFDVVEGSDLLYMSDPDNWRCKFCGCSYVYDARITQVDCGQWHRPGCLWLRIKKIHPYHR